MCWASYEIVAAGFYCNRLYDFGTFWLAKSVGAQGNFLWDRDINKYEIEIPTPSFLLCNIVTNMLVVASIGCVPAS